MTLDIVDVISGNVGVGELIDGVYSFFCYFLESSAVKPVIGAMDPLLLGVVLILFFLMLTLFGERMIGFFNFVILFLIGYVIGAAYILYLPEPFFISAVIVGISSGIVSALLSKVLYYAFLIPVSGFLVYLPIVTGFFSKDTAGDYLLSVSLAAAFVILVFIFRPFAERVVTAFLGAFGIAESLRLLWDYTSLEVFSLCKWLPVLLFTLVFGIIGFVLQTKTRPSGKGSKK